MDKWRQNLDYFAMGSLETVLFYNEVFQFMSKTRFVVNKKWQYLKVLLYIVNYTQPYWKREFESSYVYYTV